MGKIRVRRKRVGPARLPVSIASIAGGINGAPPVVDEEPTNTERAIAAVRKHLNDMQQALGAGSVESHGRNIMHKRQRHRASLTPSAVTAPVSALDDEESPTTKSTTSNAERTATERAMAAVRNNLNGMHQALGAGHAETAQRILRHKPQPTPTPPTTTTTTTPAAPPPIATVTTATAATVAATGGSGPDASTVATTGGSGPDAKTEEGPSKAAGMTGAGTVEGVGGQQQKKKGKTKTEKRDLVTRYIVLIVCIAVMIFCLLGMSFLSWKSNGRWWGPLPEHKPLLGG